MATLKVSDLSVGDWVMVEWPDGERWRGRLTRLSVTGGVEVRCANGKHVRCSSDFISSIPITAEILEKNGWRVIEKEVFGDEYEYDGEKRVWDDYSIDICETKPGVFWYSWRTEYYMWRLEYVHQLQHLIRLAGVDKEINL